MFAPIFILIFILFQQFLNQLIVIKEIKFFIYIHQLIQSNNRVVELNMGWYQFINFIFEFEHHIIDNMGIVILSL
jgi:hypothetical protein